MFHCLFHKQDQIHYNKVYYMDLYYKDIFPYIVQPVLDCNNLHITYRNMDMFFHQIHILHSLVMGSVSLFYTWNISLDMVMVLVEDMDTLLGIVLGYFAQDFDNWHISKDKH